MKSRDGLTPGAVGPRSTRRRRGGRTRPRRSKPGQVPGTLLVDPEAPACVVDVHHYDRDRLTLSTPAPAHLARLNAASGVSWVNVTGLGTESVLQEIASTFGVHPLAMEDVVNTHQRPKVEEYGEHIFVVLRLPHVDDSTNAVTIEQIAIYAGDGFVLTFQEYAGDCFDPIRQRLDQSRGRIRKRGADYLMYALVDAVVDNYFPLLERFGDRLDALEDEIIAGAATEVLGRLLDIKRDLLRLRRSVWPLRDALRLLLTGGHEFLSEDTRLYLRDCYDHLVVAVDMLDNQREVDSNLVNVHLSVVSQKMNEVMKVLTIIATVFIPLGFVAGLYGMNFNAELSPWNMPELSWYYGYPAALGLMAGITSVMLVFFYRKGWLSRS